MSKVIFENGQEVQLAISDEIAITSREFSSETEIPEHPTINGFVNDTVIDLPKRLEVSGIVSNIKDYKEDQKTDPSAYSLKYLGLFEDLRTSKEVLTVEVNNRQYPNMRLRSYTFSEDGTFSFTLSFQEVFYATTKKVASKKIVKKKVVSANNPKKQAIANNKTSQTNNVKSQATKVDKGTGITKTTPELKSSNLYKAVEFAKKYIRGNN
jgi:hypothetical protein